MTVQYPLCSDAPRGHHQNRWGCQLFICPRSWEGRRDTSANGNTAHVCVCHLRVNGAEWALAVGRWGRHLISCHGHVLMRLSLFRARPTAHGPCSLMGPRASLCSWVLRSDLSPQVQHRMRENGMLHGFDRLALVPPCVICDSFHI